MRFGSDGFQQECEKVSLLLLTSGDGGPHSLVITLTGLTAGALGDLPVDHAMADLLFSVVVQPQISKAWNIRQQRERRANPQLPPSTPFTHAGVWEGQP